MADDIKLDGAVTAASTPGGGHDAAKATSERRANEAMVAMRPTFRHSLVGGTLAFSTAGFEAMEWKETLAAYNAAAADIGTGNLTQASNMLTSQALTLDAVFTELLSRATKNMGQYPEAVERYMRLAMKAQAQSRATLEALAKIHQPREQIVRHVHVYEGGQAVVAEQLHMHGPGVVNAGSDDQSHTARAGRVGERASLSSPNPLGDTVPIAGSPGKAQVPDARRHQSRRASRQSQRVKARPADG